MTSVQHQFESFIVNVCPQGEYPMQLVNMALPIIVELPSTGAFFYAERDDSGRHNVFFQRDIASSKKPELSFQLSISELDTLKKCSVLPVKKCDYHWV